MQLTQTTRQFLTGFGVPGRLSIGSARRFYSHTCGGFVGHDCGAFAIGALNGTVVPPPGLSANDLALIAGVLASEAHLQHAPRHHIVTLRTQK